MFKSLSRNDVNRLEEIQSEIAELMREAKRIFRGTNEEDRFISYPYGNIMSALHKDGEYMNNYDTTLECCINDVHVDEEDEDEDEDDGVGLYTKYTPPKAVDGLKSESDDHGDNYGL